MPDGFASTLARPTRATSLPSIEALARIRHQHDTAAEKIATTWVLDRRYQNAASDLAGARTGALDDLILSLPACTLADAVPQIARAMSIMENLCDDEEPGSPSERMHQEVMRVLTSILPVVIEASGVDADELIDTDWPSRQHDKLFGTMDSRIGECGA